jgi:ribosomal protein S18 acetylase RimI-like enzyme
MQKGKSCFVIFMLPGLKYFYRVTRDHDISVAAKKDVPVLVELVNEAYRNVDTDKGWTTEANLFKGSRATEESLKSLLTHADSVFLKCTRNNKIIGCVYLQKQQPKMYLGVLAVAPEFQNAGIGKGLLAAAEAYALKRKCRTIIMTVISIRHELIAWYKRRGYHETGEVKPFPDDSVNVPNRPLELLVLEKNI